MILSNLKHFFIKNKKTILFFVFFVVLFSFDSSFAGNAEVPAQQTGDTTNSETLNFLSYWIEIALKVVSVLLGLLTALATLFLSPEWISGNIFGLSEHFKKVWILVSNVVYFIFAFLLIWIAFMNIIGKNADQYQLKQALPKFVIGVLIVPFSWFLVQFILSISAILTISAISLPADTFSEFGDTLSDTKVPNLCTLELTSSGSTREGGYWNCDKEDGVPIDDLLNGSDGIATIYGIISMYTYGIISFDTIDDIDPKNLNFIKTSSDLFIKLLFDIIFVLVYSILMITLGIVLMIRGIYIWIYIMMSPVFGLMYFFGDKANKGFFEKFNLKEFIALAMVPVYTMLALSFGLLFMYVVGSGMVEGSTTGAGNGASELVSIGDGKAPGGNGNPYIKISNFRVEIKGEISNSGDDVTGLLKNIGEGTLGVIGGFILKLFGIVVLWGTIMAAMRTSEITKQITEPIYQFGTKVGGIMASAPGNIPIFGGQSANSMSTAVGTIQSSITTAQNQKGTALGQKFLGGTELTKNYQKLGNNVGGDRDSHLKNVKAVISAGELKELVQNKSGIDALAKQLRRLAQTDGFKDKDQALKDINNLEKNGVGNEDLVSGILSKLDKDGASPTLSILGGKDDIAKGDVKDHFGKGADTSTTGVDKIKNEELEGNKGYKISVGNITSIINTDNGEIKEEKDKKDLINLVINALNNGNTASEINTTILSHFNNSEDILKDNIFYNEVTKTYSSSKKDSFKQIKYDGLFENNN